MGKREDQKNKRRYDILLAGLELFVKKGFSATKVTDIAEEANMSVGLLFHYFDSKEKLYEELIRSGLAGTKNVMNVISENPLDFFRDTARTILNYLKEDPSTSKMFVLMAQASLNDSAPQVVKDLVSQVDNITTSIPMIEEGQRLGLIREGNPMSLSMAFWCSLQGIAEEIAYNPDIPYPEADWIVDILRKH